MGLISTAIGSAARTFSDQYKEYFYCDALPANVLAVKGRKRGNKGDDNIISNGSVIAVADGQCMMIVDNGKVVEVCAEPGEFVYDFSTEPSIFYGGLGKGILETFKQIGKRITFGGTAPKTQRIYYFNTKEITGNKYGTPNPVPFRVVDTNIGLDIDISVRCFGEFSYRICNPLLFYTNVCGNINSDYTRAQLDGQMKSELITALQPTFARISEMGIRYSALPGHTMELSDTLNTVMSAKWRELRGLEVVSVGVSSIKALEEDEKMIKELQRNATFRDPTMAAAHMVGAQASAMQAAASNTAGAAAAFMGMNMAGAAGGMNAQSLFQMGQQQRAQAQAPAPAADSWQCSCGTTVSGNFCPNCGTKKPAPQGAGWKCVCGTMANGKFCPNCGTKKPEEGASDGWTCSCGAVNKGKFCAECGAKKPAGAPLYRCDKCGWEPADPTNPPKFCPECGDLFDENDIQQ